MNKHVMAAFWEKSFMVWSLLVIFSAVLVLSLAVSVGDNDLWWHLEYGEYMLNNHTLRPDHTIYSWTETDKNWVYVTWIPDIAFYILYSFGGVHLLVLLRYLCFGAVCTLIISYGMKTQGEKVTPVTLLTVLIVISRIVGFSSIKPELLSIVFFTLTLYVYFYNKSKGKDIFFCYPLIFLFWVNCHGLFIFGILLITILLVGETAGSCLRHKSSFSVESLKKFAIFVALSYAVVLVNPYGISYPIEIFKILTSPVFREYADTIKAILSPFEKQKQLELFGYKGISTYISVYLAIALIVIFIISTAVLYLKKRIVYIPIVLANIVFAFLFFRHMRTTLFYPLVWGFSILHLYSHLHNSGYKKKSVRFINIMSLILFLLFSANILYYSSSNRIWLGMNSSDLVPEKEINFLMKHDLLKYKMFNDYYIGGYLIWALYPDQKVFIDPRGGPFLSSGVFGDYKRVFLEAPYEVSSGLVIGDKRDIKARELLFKQFAAKYPFRIALINQGQDYVIFPFLMSDDWRLIYFDTNAIIFVHKSVDTSHIKEDLGPQRFASTKHLHELVQIFTLYLNMNDINSAQYIFTLIQMRFEGHRELIDYLEKMLAAALSKQR